MASTLMPKIKYRIILSLRRCSKAINGLAYHIEKKKILTRRDKEILKRNARFASCYKGKRAFVIGNGPSLKSQDLSLLKNEITFTCNAFYLHPILSEWQPTYHSHIDPAGFDGSVPVGTWFEEICAKMPTTIFFAPYNARNVIMEKKLLPEDRAFYCYFAGRMSEGVKHVNLTQPIPGAINACLFSLSVAIFMGCNPIYLIGMDHDWLAIREVDPHFYEGTVINGATLAADRTKIKYGPYMRQVLMLWEGYENLKMFASVTMGRI